MLTEKVGTSRHKLYLDGHLRSHSEEQIEQNRCLPVDTVQNKFKQKCNAVLVHGKIRLEEEL